MCKVKGMLSVFFKALSLNFTMCAMCIEHDVQCVYNTQPTIKIKL